MERKLLLSAFDKEQKVPTNKSNVYHVFVLQSTKQLFLWNTPSSTNSLFAAHLHIHLEHFKHLRPLGRKYGLILEQNSTFNQNLAHKGPTLYDITTVQSIQHEYIQQFFNLLSKRF